MNQPQGLVAGRLARPSWRDPRLLIGLALIAASVVAVSSIVQRADRTEPIYAARDTLTPGTVLEPGDLVVTDVRVGDGYLAGDAEPWGKVVTRVVQAGELVPASALADSASFTSSPIAVHSALALPAGIEAGSIVDVWLTREAEDGVPKPELVAEGLVVAQVDRDSGSFSAAGDETVYVVVPSDSMEGFLAALATEGEISVVGRAGA